MHEEARKLLVRASKVTDPLATLQEQATEANAVRRLLAARVLADPSQAAALLQEWGNVSVLLLRALQAWMAIRPPALPRAELDGRSYEPSAELVAGALRILHGEVVTASGVPLSYPPGEPRQPALAPFEDEATPDPQQAVSADTEDHSASELMRLCKHEQVSRFPRPPGKVIVWGEDSGDTVVCAHCSQEWSVASATALGIWHERKHL